MLHIGINAMAQLLIFGTLLSSLGLAQIIWDGRIPQSTTLVDFDSATTSRYNPDFVLGAGTEWCNVIKFPANLTSMFDRAVGAKSLEVTINDKSIFAPGGKPQNGFRRSELIPLGNNGKDSTVNGITTLHFSIRPDQQRPLNLSHEYQLAFIETNDFSSHVWTLKLGTPFGQTLKNSPSAYDLRIESSTADGEASVILYQTPWLNYAGWHNFAIQTDWDSSEITIYSSTAYLPLQQVVSQQYNNATGKGQAHVGILKLPTDSTNPTQNGYQESNLNEGVIYGGIFIEKGDSVTLKPQFW